MVVDDFVLFWLVVEGAGEANVEGGLVGEANVDATAAVNNVGVANAEGGSIVGDLVGGSY